MSYSPFAYSESLQIGTIEFISPNEATVTLNVETPDTVALNAGDVRPFPRVNGYVLMPADNGHLVGQIEWMTIEKSPFPQRKGMRDFGLVDLPCPLRKMKLNILGTLRRERTGELTDTREKEIYDFQRGAYALPSVGSPVLLPTKKQLHAIIESGAKRRVDIGISPLAADATVSINPDRLFGRHLAVLGNTGSGKSCSVAGLIRWSLEAAQREATQKRAGQGDDSKSKKLNSRFIILDPNGEYLKAFTNTDEHIKAKIFQLNPKHKQHKLKIPLWFWSSAEWASFTQASAKTQRPTLIHALRYARDNKFNASRNENHKLRRYLRTLVLTLKIEENNGTPWKPFPQPKNFYNKIDKWRKSLESDLNKLQNEEYETLSIFVQKLQEICKERSVKFPDYDFSKEEITDLITAAENSYRAFGGIESDIDIIDADTPLPFTESTFLSCIDAAAEILNVSEHVETLLIRVKSLLKDKKISSIIDSTEKIDLDKWLIEYIGNNDEDDNHVTVIDLSLIPTEIVHIITAVIARIIFEALQRYKKFEKTGSSLPTVLVMEEAHTFIKRYKDDSENFETATACCKIFERIAREGRKFGLGLVLSSQRPSELSPTVLSQCNTFLLHRISNDRDQELVSRLVPDNLRGLLRELPSLPSQYAILLGWASELPVLVKMHELHESQQPQSDDPDYWDVWTGEAPRKINWKTVANDWQGINDQSEGEN